MTDALLLDKFEIFFENETGVFQEGSSVTGLVIIENAEDLTYKNIRIELRGAAIVFWAAQEDKESPDKSAFENDDLKGDCNKEQYFQKVVLLEKDGNFIDKDPVLSAGQHSLPFACRLLAELPSSFEGRHGRVRYEAQAIITRPMFKSDIVVKRPFTVASGLDLSFVPEAPTKIEICKYRELGMCCTEGSITFDWTVDRSGFIAGEDIWIQGSVQNDSKHSVSQSMVTLFMVVDYRANKKRRQEKKVIASVEKGTTLTDDVTIWNEPIHIPDLPPTGLNRCRLIDIKYELEFRATIDSVSSPVMVTKEIYIGTIPLVVVPSKSCKSSNWADSLERSTAAAASYGDWCSMNGDVYYAAVGGTSPPYYCGPAAGYPCGDASYTAALAEFITPTVSYPISAVTDPSAPLLAVFVDGQGEEFRPPPFAPGHCEKNNADRAKRINGATRKDDAASPPEPASTEQVEPVPLQQCGDSEVLPKATISDNVDI